MSIDYGVNVLLGIDGSPKVASELDRVAGKADKAGAAFHDMAMVGAEGLASVGREVSGLIDGFGHMAMHAGLAVGAAGLGGAILALKKGISISDDLEQTSIGFATMFRMADRAKDMNEGLMMSRDLVGMIRKDAKDLPGEFGDFVSMAQTLTSPMLQAGGGVKEIRDMTRQTVVAAAAMKVPFEQAGREMAMMLEGNISSHMPLAARLGLDAKTKVDGKGWKDASISERVDFITKKLKTGDEALALYSHSWAGLTSTLVDTGKQLLTTAAAPVIERMKDTMIRLTGWTDKNGASTEALAHNIGIKLANAYDFVEAKIEKLPARFESAKGQVLGLVHALEDGFHRAWPIIEKVGTFLEGKVEHPAQALRELLMLRVGAGAAQMAPSAIGGAFKLAGMFGGGGGGAGGADQMGGAIAKKMVSSLRDENLEKALGSIPLFGGAAAGEEGLFGAGGGAVGESMAGSGLVAGEAAGGAALGGGAALALTALPLMAAGVAAIDDTMGSWTHFVMGMKDLWKETMAVVEPLVAKGGLLRDILGVVGASVLTTIRIGLLPLTLALKGVGWALEELNAGWTMLKDFFSTHMGNGIKELMGAFGGLLGWLGKVKDFILGIPGLSASLGYDLKGANGAGNDYGTSVNENAFAHADDRYANPEAAGAANRKTAAPPHVDARGSTFKIELNVRDNDPDRIARKIFGKIGEAAARPLTASSGFSPQPRAY